VKSRLDKLLVDRGLTPSRERAQALILAGRVLVDEQKVEKSGASVDGDAAIRILGDDQPYVSRGGLKLAHALEHWHIDVWGKTCLDIGASTGGFTDCLLQAGAARVIAIDTGYGQMDATLRNDPRVRLLEKTNARYLTPEQVFGPRLGQKMAKPFGKLRAGTGAQPVQMAEHGKLRAGTGSETIAQTIEPIAFVAMDVSFISATLVLPAVVQCARSSSDDFELVVLVKPQFEAGREHVGKGGIVRDPEVQQAAVERVMHAVEELGGSGIDTIDSPILGTEGNREFLLHAAFM
jgi:23S rRNA (cytidine1920-2'-O)/16S rRNA (cytidine1409-2'-O)-methyltransferase